MTQSETGINERMRTRGDKIMQIVCAVTHEIAILDKHDRFSCTYVMDKPEYHPCTARTKMLLLTFTNPFTKTKESNASQIAEHITQTFQSTIKRPSRCQKNALLGGGGSGEHRASCILLPSSKTTSKTCSEKRSLEGA